MLAQDHEHGFGRIKERVLFDQIEQPQGQRRRQIGFNAFSSSLQRRRPLAPVITSTRRTAVTCGSAISSSLDTSRSPNQEIRLAQINRELKVGSKHRLRPLRQSGVGRRDRGDPPQRQTSCRRSPPPLLRLLAGRRRNGTARAEGGEGAGSCAERHECRSECAGHIDFGRGASSTKGEEGEIIRRSKWGARN